MKLLSDFPDTSMSMGASTHLKSLLDHVLAEENVSYVFESGTYLGLGSTKFIAEAFRKDEQPELFVTVEANWMSWRAAKRNLRCFPFVRPLWGRTVPADKALQFLHSDDVLRQHENYSDVFIDNIEDPLKFYTEEINGKLGVPSNRFQKVCQAVERPFVYAGDNLLEHYLMQFQKLKPLITLDSAGGVGFLEFSVMKNAMGENPYLILLDDINHIKHFRSYQHIVENPNYHIFGVDENEGWLFAKYLKE